jgi:hypothetical protein
MRRHILPKVEDLLKTYQTDHRGEMPLYIIVSPGEIDQLLSEVKEVNGLDNETLVTTYKGSKIVKYDALTEGDFELSNELPETGS